MKSILHKGGPTKNPLFSPYNNYINDKKSFHAIFFFWNFSTAYMYNILCSRFSKFSSSVCIPLHCREKLGVAHRVVILTVNIVRMFPEDVLVQCFCFVKLAHGFMKTRQVVCCGDRYSTVVTLVSLALLFAPLKR